MPEEDYLREARETAAEVNITNRSLEPPEQTPADYLRKQIVDASSDLSSAPTSPSCTEPDPDCLRQKIVDVTSDLSLSPEVVRRPRRSFE